MFRTQKGDLWFLDNSTWWKRLFNLGSRHCSECGCAEYRALGVRAANEDLRMMCANCGHTWVEDDEYGR